MAATEGFFLPYKMAVLKWDPAIIRDDRFTSAISGKLSRINFVRIATGVTVCIVDCETGGAYFPSGSFPGAGQISAVSGITQIVIQ